MRASGLFPFGNKHLTDTKKNHLKIDIPLFGKRQRRLFVSIILSNIQHTSEGYYTCYGFVFKNINEKLIRINTRAQIYRNIYHACTHIAYTAHKHTHRYI